ncbi:MAG: T9SS type A sorting domain-containing protein [Bacteroidia bacterium]|nr:T9SS type A sorting domain-containing protein [Bacteroidia bacterium]
MANGGGGGNNHNAGGAGGGNYGAGGAGGSRIAGFATCAGNDPGRGGNSLSSFGYSIANQRLFLGGGGGAGHSNNVGNGMPGGNGAGIIIITADEIEGNGFGIYARGNDAMDSGSDGGSGGGAGGVIVLEANTLTPPFALNVKGGDGGDTGISQCQGPGGGGGGGVIWSSVITPIGITLNGNGGVGGTATVSGCGGAQGAGTGGAGIVGAGYSRPTSSGVACVLPAYWQSLKASVTPTGVRLEGKLHSAESSFYQVRVKRNTGKEWKEVGILQTERSLRNELNPLWEDRAPILGKQKYQMFLVDADGKEIPSPVVEALWTVEEGFSWRNMSWTDNTMEIWIENPAQAWFSWELFGMDGRKVWGSRAELEKTKGVVSFELPDVEEGLYLLRVSRNGQTGHVKIIK